MADLQRVTADDLADYILAKCGPVSHLKLHKLLYYVEAWHLALFEKAILNEDFEAWLHGPVVRRIFARFRNRGILAFDDVPVPDAQLAEIIAKVERQLSPDQVDLIADVLGEYGNKSGYHLECLTHSEQPWIDARKGVAPGEASSNKISKETMRNFYAQRIA